jgi:hypothetical protein
MQNNLQITRKLQISLQSDSVTNGNSEAPTSFSDKQLCLSAIVDEGKGAVALTEVISAKNKIAISSNIEVSPVNKMLDKAECDKLRVLEEGRRGGAIPQGTGLYEYGYQTKQKYQKKWVLRSR